MKARPVGAGLAMLLAVGALSLGCSNKDAEERANKAATRAEDSARRAEAAASRVEAAAKRTEAAASRAEAVLAHAEEPASAPHRSHRHK